MLGSNTRSQAASRPSPDRSALRSWGGLVRILHWFTAKRTGSRSADNLWWRCRAGWVFLASGRRPKV